MSAECRPTTQEFCKKWAEKLRKARSETSCSNQSILELGSIANLLYTLPIEGPPHIVVKKFAQTKHLFVTVTTIHVHTLCLCKKDKLNSILLATCFGLVDKVRIDSFYIYRYLRADRVHVRIAQCYWGIVEFIIPYICRGP